MRNWDLSLNRKCLHCSASHPAWKPHGMAWMFKSSSKDSAQAWAKAFSPLLDQCCCTRGDGSCLWVLCAQADISSTPSLALRVCTCFIANSFCPSPSSLQKERECGEGGKEEREEKAAGTSRCWQDWGLASSLLNKTHVSLSLFSPLPPLPSHIHNFRKI